MPRDGLFEPCQTAMPQQGGYVTECATVAQAASAARRGDGPTSCFLHAAWQPDPCLSTAGDWTVRLHRPPYKLTQLCFGEMAHSMIAVSRPPGTLDHTVQHPPDWLNVSFCEAAGLAARKQDATGMTGDPAHLN